MGLAGQYLDQLPYRVWVLLGDSEMAEGSIWEAFELARQYRLSNITAIIDVNRLGQRGETMLCWNLDAYASRASAFGWQAPDDRRPKPEAHRRRLCRGRASRVLAMPSQSAGFSKRSDARAPARGLPVAGTPRARCEAWNSSSSAM
jgi:hypothetical protein